METKQLLFLAALWALNVLTIYTILQCLAGVAL